MRTGKITSIISFFLAIIVVIPIALLPKSAVRAEDSVAYLHARPTVNGNLSVKGTQLVDKDGNPVILRGVSTHGLTWYPDFIDNNIFKQLSEQWECNLVRLPMYSEVYVNHPVESISLVEQGIEYAVNNELYVIVDWHILNDGDPNTNIEEALQFFELISTSYSHCPNIIYEICNEPNGETSWEDVRTYADRVIPLIRSHNPDALVIVGTPVFDRSLLPAVREPLEYDNVMYALHFYAGSHYGELQYELQDAIDRGLPVFVSECGLSESSGDGDLDYENAVTWFNLLKKNGISFAVWSLSNKDETSAMLYPDYDPEDPITKEDLTPVGAWVKDLTLGEDPATIKIREPRPQNTILPLWVSKNITERDRTVMANWPRLSLIAFGVTLLFILTALALKTYNTRVHKTYDSFTGNARVPVTGKALAEEMLKMVALLLSFFFTLLYLTWRISYSMPWEFGAIAIAANILLLVVEIFGFIESIILYIHLMGMRKHALPEISDDEYPDVDIFIATYNEPEDLLERTINACKHLSYPDKDKVHIWVCDDNRRASMHELADRMQVGYFDRPDNKGAKAGNLNCALARTTSPYVVTLDADMIVKSDFLLKTIPYFVDNAKRNSGLPKEKQAPLGLLQTPQCFYEPDVFQYALYSEKNAPNEQDFFYRTIEVAKTSSNSVIYGGSNTVISRAALEKIGGFYTESITEDFATGLLIESNGFVSLGLGEPLASGKTPETFAEHIKQRIRWGRGVISTARQLHILTRKGLSLSQRFSYWSSVAYWHSPVKNLIYLLSPLFFALLAIPVFKCSWIDLLIFWLPMFIMQDLCLRANSHNAVSLKWSGIYETSVMPYLLIPIIKEFFGITTKKFAVTDKSKKTGKRRVSIRSLMPFLILIALCLGGIIRSVTLIKGVQSLGLLVLIIWLVRNLYFLIMSLFLADGRDGDEEAVRVIDAEPVTVKRNIEGAPLLEGITTYLTEHSFKVFLDEPMDLAVGESVTVTLENDSAEAVVSGVVTAITPSRTGISAVYSIEILDYKDDRFEYLQILYDRIPSLPQSLNRDYGIISHLLRNVAHRILR